MDAPPNEIGDTIAGIFATLAFVWIVVTVFLQSAELAEQRKELTLTRQELTLAREAQEKQVGVLQAQAEIFLDEKKYRDEVRAYSEVQALMLELESIIKSDQFLESTWHFDRLTQNGSTSRDFYTLVFSSDHFRKLSDTALLAFLIKILSKAQSNVENAISSGSTLTKNLDLSVELDWIHRSIERIDQLHLMCSKADQVRIRSLGLDRLREVIEEIQDHPSYWRIWAGETTS